MNTIREIEKINEQELERGIAGTPASWHAQYANSAWCYVGNLDHALTEGDVICIMSQFGEIDDIHLVREEDTGKSRGFGFVKYEDARSCVLAVDNLIGSQILGRSLRIDHVEHYRLPKKLQEQEEEKGKNQRLGAAGHAYEGVELENQYNVKQGVDLFAPVSQNEKGVDEPGSGTEDEKEAKRRRKEERQRRREEKEERRRRKEEKRERKEEKKRKKRARELEHDDNNSDDDGTSSTNHHRRERKHKSSKKRRHSKESPKSNRYSFHQLLASILCLVVTRLWIFPIPVTAWTAHNQNVRHHTPTKTQLQASRWNEVPVAIQDELGCSPTLTLLLNQPEPFFFDPFNLATDETFAIYREAELKHGRVAMVSVVSCIFSTLVNEVAKANQTGTLEKLWSSILASLVKTPGAANPALPIGEVVVKVPVNPQQQLIPVPSPLNLLQEWSVWDYLRMIVVCGIIEIFVWVQMDAQDMPGDYQVGYWGVRDKGLHERSLICELENGRLAMIVMLYYISVDVWKVFGPAMIEQLSTAAEK